MLEGPSWEALWSYMCVPDILQTRATAQEFNHATNDGPYCELFFVVLKPEPEPRVSTAFLGTFQLAWLACAGNFSHEPERHEAE